MQKSLGFLLLILLSCCILVTSEKSSQKDTQDQPDEDLTFQEFKIKFKKSYKNSQQVETRKSSYRGNIEKLKNADCGACGITSFFDKNEDQLKKMRGLDSEKPDDFNMKDIQDDSQNDKQKESLRKNKNSTEVPNVGLAYTASTSTSTTQTLSTSTIISTGFDWRKMGMITPVKNQGECKACWAFATVSMFESALIRKGLASNLTADLSEQYLIQCDTSSSGCKGGNPTYASQFVKSRGIPGESSYQYNYNKSYPGICITATQYSFNTSQYNVYFKTTRMSDASIIAQLVVRPLLVYVTSTYWQFYKPVATNRIFTCRSTQSLSVNTLDHAVILVGYTDTEWIIKNSWGTDYGVDGYIYVSRTVTKNCGIGFYVGSLA